MQISVDIPDDLALRLSPLQDKLPEILELGLREWNTQGEPGFSGLSDILEMLAKLPTAEEILALNPSASLQQQVTVVGKKPNGRVNAGRRTLVAAV